MAAGSLATSRKNIDGDMIVPSPTTPKDEFDAFTDGGYQSDKRRLKIFPNPEGLDKLGGATEKPRWEYDGDRTDDIMT